MSESVRDRVVRVLDLEGALCGQCGREPGSPLADCPDCGRVLGGYADALAAAGLLRDEPEWEYGSAVLPDALAPALPKDSRESAEAAVADLAQWFPRAAPCVKRRRKSVPAGPWEVCDD